ncbi:type I-E CRISPR-associated protein Cse2/CasB [Methylobacter luteus]|uniref:type I-E CRISPR-associated protein Cse2/CasB n=1 Tax=Methylobacter luteus TaxID=415 RepID=UPI00041C1ABD|nr:type I-E CRISPR-associated protein Cse2/CasB [Methylobacter luteus]
MSTETSKIGKSEAFVKFTVEQCQKDKGIAAGLRRADNPATEYQCWEHLAAFYIDLEKDFERLPYATIAAAIAKAKVDHNGAIGIGRAISLCYEDGNNSDQAKARLRRLLACESVEEACRILRPLFSLIDSKASVTLNYAQLLADLLKFHWDNERVKARWAQDFYSRMVDKEAS